MSKSERTVMSILDELDGDMNRIDFGNMPILEKRQRQKLAKERAETSLKQIIISEFVERSKKHIKYNSDICQEDIDRISREYLKGK